MNNYNPNIHHRRSIRLKGYDYSQAGLYFITICVQDRKCLFGEIVIVDDVRVENFQARSRQKMLLNDAGKIADDCWLEIPRHFPNVVLHEHIVMPNHVHGIIELIKIVSPNVGAENFLPLHSSNESLSSIRVENFQPERNEFQKIIPHSIGSIVRGFKIGVTKWFRNNSIRVQNIESLQSPNESLSSIRVQNIEPQQIWQRNYYEHIIRSEQSFRQIADYIKNNPNTWNKDDFFNE